MTETEKLALALQAIEAAKGIISQTFHPHDDLGTMFCQCCVRPVTEDGRLQHDASCEVKAFLELVTKLEQSK